MSNQYGNVRGSLAGFLLSQSRSAEKRIFSASDDYDKTLQGMKKDFDAKWSVSTTSPESGLSDFTVLRFLGQGSFGKVRLVKAKVYGDCYAAKMMMKAYIIKKKQISHVFNEKKVLQSMDFPFHLSLQWSRKDHDAVYLGLPFVNGGELFSYHRSVHKFSESQARFYAAQICLALEYMHFNQMLYRDLKPENILIDRHGYLKMTDYGFCKKVESRTLTLCGTPEFMAPELIETKPYGTSVDWWAFGVLLFEFVHGTTPFHAHHKDLMVMYEKIVRADIRWPNAFSGSLKDLLYKLLQADVTQRIGCMGKGCKDIKNHSWFQSINWIAVLNKEIVPPYTPDVKNAEDISQFDKKHEKDRDVDKLEESRSRANKYADIFADF